MKIEKIEPSNVKNKRYKITLDDGKIINFGLKGGSTYIDHKDKKKRDAYRKRHYGNDIERLLIDHYTPSPATFSYYLLWGEHTDLNKNIDDLNKKLKKYNTI
jgi:hypothetical protein